ncbi:hypothetical protein MtrunA17_Chr7g0261961 [Medicago truncatula]|uniref:ABC transporter, putative n=1 Tax=Medicago truncatula TaxID=3880 RepID=G7KXE6_MEDTR|nr:ABC transporter, putative [Medicago truncatula]RHN48268.1 hypothetical protein MtrunA17_Chr7g0261961 [Medicago truncatula]
MQEKKQTKRLVYILLLSNSVGSQTVEGFLRNYFGFKNDFLGVVALVNVAFPIVFALFFPISIKMFSFQRR